MLERLLLLLVTGFNSRLLDLGALFNEALALTLALLVILAGFSCCRLDSELFDFGCVTNKKLALTLALLLATAGFSALFRPDSQTLDLDCLFNTG